MKVGFIGCGGRAGSHMEALKALSGAEIVAFADIVEERARLCAQKYGGRAYGDYHVMLEKEGLDACYICLPPFAHTDQELLCAEKGVPFFIEKPVALTLEKAREVERAVDKADLITLVGYQLRFVDALVEMRKVLLEEGGRIGLCEAVRCNGVAGGPDHWWRKRELSGGQLVEQSTHQVDLARWFVGEVTQVYARLDNLLSQDLPNYTIEDVSIVTLKFENGALGVITSTTAAQPKGSYSRFTVVAKNLEVMAFPGYRIVKGQEVREYESKVDSTMEINRHFLQCIEKGQQTRIPYSEGLKDLEVTLAAVKSSETGRTVKLPL
ncbi:MAG: Gfo/Idh/MocA family oxidoreductase [Candidatus Bathyarchaeia archaeon]